MNTQGICRGNPVMRRQGSKLNGAADKKCVATDEERIRALARKCGKGRLDLSDRAGIKDLELQAEGRGGFLRASRNVASVTAGLLGLTKTATRTAFGTSSCRSRNRFATVSWTRKLVPVALPPGRARLATKPSLTGSTATCRRTKSAIRPGRRSYWRSSQWYPIVAF